jgi:ribosomal protein S18 acetylase RimI-like enzyme
MDPTPPPGHTVRAPTAADAETVFGLFAAHNTAVLGSPDLTLEDIAEELVEPGFDLTTDAWLAFDAAGQPSGYGCMYRSSGAGEHHIEFVADDPALAVWLRDRALARCREVAAAGGHGTVSVDIGVYRADEPQRARVAEAGFGPGTTYHRMRIDHVGPVAAPGFPAGVIRRTGDDGIEVRRAGHAVLEAAFAGQFGISPQAFDEWHATREARTSFTWSQLVVLEADGTAVAVREDNDQFVDDEGCGYIQRLGVADGARGRGLAKLLLRDAFATHAAAGRAGTLLHVDTNNPTPALALYTSVGMEAVLVIDGWRAVLPT